MRVCYVAARARGGDGWGRYAAAVASGVRAHGVTPVLVTSEPSVDPVLQDVEHHAILQPPLSRRFSTVRSLGRIRRFRQIAATCDVIHGLVEPYAPLIAFGRPRNVPFVQTAHGTWAVEPLRSRPRRWLFGPAFRRADRIVFQSRFTRDWMAELMALPPHVVLPGGGNPSAGGIGPSATLPEWTARGPVVLSVGAVKERKGHRTALEAVGLAHATQPGFRYVVVGTVTAEEKAVLQARAAELGIADQVHVLGHVPADELAAWYRRATVLLLLPATRGSSFEGLGLVYLEAAAAGTPSIGTLRCGAGEAILHEETGLLVPQEDPAAAARALLRLLGDDGLRARLGAAARRRAAELSWDKLARQLVALYEELLRSRRSRARR